MIEGFILINELLNLFVFTLDILLVPESAQVKQIALSVLLIYYITCTFITLIH